MGRLGLVVIVIVLVGGSACTLVTGLDDLHVLSVKGRIVEDGADAASPIKREKKGERRHDETADADAAPAPSSATVPGYGVRCGPVAICEGETPICCVGLNREGDDGVVELMQCIDEAVTTCQGMPFRCDQTADCEEGEVCCWNGDHNKGEATCMRSRDCKGALAAELGCTSDEECPKGKHCAEFSIGYRGCVW